MHACRHLAVAVRNLECHRRYVQSWRALSNFHYSVLEGTYRITGTGQLDIFGRGQGHYMIASSATVGGQAHMPLCVSAGARFSHIRKASTE